MVVKISVEKMSLKNFQMSEQNWSCLDKMSEVNFSPAETLYISNIFDGSNALVNYSGLQLNLS